MADATQERSILDALLSESRLYRSGEDYLALLDFVARLRNFAPFNAMLLQIQKPGLNHAAAAADWAERFGRYPKHGARPLLILGPSALSCWSTTSSTRRAASSPEDVQSFLSKGVVAADLIDSFVARLGRRQITCEWIDSGDGWAGSIARVSTNFDGKGANRYRLQVNRNHDAVVQFTTVTHELAHLFLGHLGIDERLHVADRFGLSHTQREIEAESVAYLVSRRNGVIPKSQSYLAAFVKPGMTSADLDVYQIMRAAGQVEGILGIAPKKLQPALSQ